MKLRNLNKMPVFLAENARVIGTVQKAVIGDDFKLSYVVVQLTDGPTGMIDSKDLSLGPETIVIESEKCIKSYRHGEEYSIYDKKMGDIVFDGQGRELGKVSDFVISPENKKVQGIEVFSGAISDVLHGRKEIALEQVGWKTAESAVAEVEGSDQEW